MTHFLKAFSGEFDKAEPFPADLNDERRHLIALEGGNKPGTKETTPNLEIPMVIGEPEVLDKYELGRGSYKDREGRIERVTLSNGNILTVVVSEAHLETPENEEIGTTFMVRGFGEIPSARKSSAHNLHTEYALRRPGKRTVSVDRLGYSPHGPALKPWEATKVGFETDEEAVKDLLAVASYYSEDGPVTLFGTSAGVAKVLEMADINQSLGTEQKLNIDHELIGVVPCLVAKHSPEGTTFYTPEEKMIMLKRAIIVARFALHTGINLGEAIVKHPQDTLANAGIVEVFVKKPSLLFVLPPQFIRHTVGVEFDLLTRVIENHNLIIREAQSDPLRADTQYEYLNTIRKESVDRQTLPGGHLTVPMDVDGTLNSLGIIGSEEIIPKPGLVETGVKLGVSTIYGLGKFAASKVSSVSRLKAA